jgi:DNA-binding response OmpR family regulator
VPKARAAPSNNPDPEKRVARVLLAEDDEAFRALMASVLRSSGYEVLEAADGIELLDHVAFGLMRGEANRTFDLLVADIKMPGHTGLEILNGMRSVSLAVPVILITAFGDAETHKSAYELGARVLDKPFDLSELELAVAAALARAGFSGLPAKRGAS